MKRRQKNEALVLPYFSTLPAIYASKTKIFYISVERKIFIRGNIEKFMKMKRKSDDGLADARVENRHENEITQKNLNKVVKHGEQDF